MKKLFIALMITTTVGLSSGCIASRKFVRNEVKTTSDTLNSRIDTTDGEVKETRDHVDRVNSRVTGVDGRVTDLDARTTEGMNSLKGDVTAVNAKADRTTNELAGLDERFSNRNNFSITAEKSVQFKFDSAKLDPSFTAYLDEIADMLAQSQDAFIVLEGHTDATGNHEYNVKLGERRVDAVRRYLAVEKGVPVYKIHEISFGAARPIADNGSRDGREKNRSVTISVLVPTMEHAAASNQ